MTTGTLTNNTKTFDLYTQNNTITLSTSQTYVDSDIVLTTKVHKAVLSTSSVANTFDVQVPNGNAADVTFTFSVDSNGNVLVT